jgi:hypothetical protein
MRAARANASRSDFFDSGKSLKGNAIDKNYCVIDLCKFSPELKFSGRQQGQKWSCFFYFQKQDFNS